MMDLPTYNPRDHYWIVADSSTQVYSSRRAAYVSTDDATYQAWLESGRLPTRIDTETNLMDVLAAAHPDGMNRWSKRGKRYRTERAARRAVARIDWSALTTDDLTALVQLVLTAAGVDDVDLSRVDAYGLANMDLRAALKDLGALTGKDYLKK